MPMKSYHMPMKSENCTGNIDSQMHTKCLNGYDPNLNQEYSMRAADFAVVTKTTSKIWQINNHDSTPIISFGFHLLILDLCICITSSLVNCSPRQDSGGGISTLETLSQGWADSFPLQPVLCLCTLQRNHYPPVLETACRWVPWQL